MPSNIWLERIWIGILPATSLFFRGRGLSVKDNNKSWILWRENVRYFYDPMSVCVPIWQLKYSVILCVIPFSQGIVKHVFAMSRGLVCAPTLATVPWERSQGPLQPAASSAGPAGRMCPCQPWGGDGQDARYHLWDYQHVENWKITQHSTKEDEIGLLSHKKDR